MNYRYEAFFDRLPMVAVGTVESVDEDTACALVAGMCGSWQTESGHNFEAGCPADVIIWEVE